MNNIFGGRTNNNGNGVNLNSKLYTSFSDTCMLTLTAWNTQLSIRVHPMNGVNADGIRQYAQDLSDCISTALTVENAIALLDGIETIILPAIKDKSHTGDVSVSVSMGSNDNRKVLTIKTDGTDVFFGIATNVSENGIADDTNVLWHKFNKRSYLIGYDNKTGSGEEIAVNTDFYNFVKKVETIYQLNSVVAHSINFHNMSKAAFSNPNTGYNNNNNNNGGFTSQTNTGYQAPVTSSNDFSSFLDGQ